MRISDWSSDVCSSDLEDEDRTDDEYRLSAGVTYQLSPDARASLAYNFQYRDSTDGDESFFENTVTVGITVSFTFIHDRTAGKRISISTQSTCDSKLTVTNIFPGFYFYLIGLS